MLVRGGVEDDVGAVEREDRVDARRVGDVGDHGVERHAVLAVAQFQVQRVQPVLVAVEHDARRRIHRGNLPAQLAADGATSAGDEHTPSGNQPAQRRVVEADRGARQQVLEPERPDVTELERAVDQVPQPRQRLDRDVVLLDRPHDRPQDGRVRIGNRDQDFVRLVGRQDAGEVLPRPEDRHAVDPMADGGVVFADESDRLVAVIGTGPHFTNEHFADGARADDQQALDRRLRRTVPALPGRDELRQQVG